MRPGILLDCVMLLPASNAFPFSLPTRILHSRLLCLCKFYYACSFISMEGLHFIFTSSKTVNLYTLYWLPLFVVTITSESVCSTLMHGSDNSTFPAPSFSAILSLNCWAPPTNFLSCIQQQEKFKYKYLYIHFRMIY